MPMTLSGDGTITGLAAGGLPNATVVQADLATGVAGTGPAFSAYLAAASQSVTASTQTKAILDTEDFDTNGCFNNTGSTVTLNGLSVPSYSFCPNVAGHYQFNVCLRPGVSSGVPAGFTMSVYKNNVEYSRLFEQGFTATGGAYGPVSGSIVVYLNGTGDYVNLYAQMAGTSPNFNNAGSQYTTRLNGFLARAA
jgi:hypothetical protein